MKNNSAIQIKIDAAMSSIDNIEAAVPFSHFYAKVLAKINNTASTVWETWSTFFLRPTIAFATICFILVVNAFVLYAKYDNGGSSSDKTEFGLSDEYNEGVIALYDFENEKP